MARTIWNRITQKEELRVLEIAREHPELSPRLLSVKITDHEEFAISESKVYEILKKNGLVRPRPLPELPEHRKPTLLSDNGGGKKRRKRPTPVERRIIWA